MRISACIITKNEEKNISRCLESIKPIVDEIVLVDTGSTDKTVEIAIGFEAKIYHFKWVKDFSKARNFALSKAKGDWIIFLDADEYFTSESSSNLKKVIILANKQKFDGVASLLFNYNDKGQVINSLVVNRIFKKTKKVQYVGAIHESLMKKDGNLCLMDAINTINIIHTGYTRSEINRKNKIKRNLELLFKELESEPHISENFYYISECFMVENDRKKALDYAYKANEVGNWKMRGTSQKNHLNIFQMLIEDGNVSNEELLNVLNDALNEFPNFPDFNIYKAELLLKEGRLHDVIEYLKIAVNNIAEVFESQSSSYMSMDVIFENLGKCYLAINEIEKAVESYVKSLKFNKYCTPSLQGLIKILSRYDNIDNIERFLSEIYDTTITKDLLYLIKSSIYVLNPMLGYRYFLRLNVEEQEMLKEEYNEILLLSGNYDEYLNRLNIFQSELSNNKNISKVFFASFVAGKEKFVTYLDKFPSPIQEFGKGLLRSNTTIHNESKKEILEVIVEFVRLGSEAILLKHSDLFRKWEILYIVAEILQEYEKHDLAINFYDQYIESCEDLPSEELGILLYKMAACLFKTNNFELALQFINDALNIYSGYGVFALGIQVAEKLNKMEEKERFAYQGLLKYNDSIYFQIHYNNKYSAL